jgi:hypothetical protein
MSDTVGPSTGDSRSPWELSLVEFLDAAVGRNPDKVFVEISGGKITLVRPNSKPRADG